VFFVLLFCLSIASLLYIKLSFCKYYLYCQVPLTSILRVTTIGIRAYQFRNTYSGILAFLNSCYYFWFLYITPSLYSISYFIWDHM